MTIAFTIPNAYLLSLCQSYFRFYPEVSLNVLPSSSPVKVRLKLIRSTASLEQMIPAGAEFVGQQEITTIWKISRRGKARFYFHFNFGNALLRVEPASGKIVGVISQDALRAPHLMVNTYVFMTLMLALRARGIYHLHTAAVLSPAQELTLICGGQRAGKTTLTTALGIAGWQPLSDDGVVLRATSNGTTELQAFKRDFHLAAVLLQQWEALRNVPVRYFYHDRACVDGLTLFNKVHCHNTTFTKVDRVLFPQVTSEKQSRLEPLPKSEALRHLIGQSMFFPLESEHTKAQLGLLAALVKDASFYRLWAGTDIWDDPHQAGILLSSQ